MSRRWLLVALSVFSVAFLLGPFSQLSMFSMMPGDLGDARLNNYFLENIYQFLTGRSESLWHLGFFSPYPYVLGFSDNLFGASPIYILARALTAEPDTAFQVWYLFGYLANYLAAFFALDRLGVSRQASIVGALIFAFALPVAAHSGHAQLHYRFGVPLSIAMFILFLDKKDWRYFSAAAAWLVWQFYCTIYIGFFALLMLVAITLVYFVITRRSRKIALNSALYEFVDKWRAEPQSEKLKVFFLLFGLLALLILLFYPYLRVSQLYGASRSLSEVATMLPRPQSYFLSDGSWLWSSQSKVFAGIPMRHEHQMFIGAVPLLLAAMGFLLGSRDKDGSAFPLLASSLGAVIVLTLYLGGFSLWFLLAKLPLASAIRAMTRIDLVLLFPAAYLASVAVDRLRNRATWSNRLVYSIIVPMLMFEMSAITPPLSSKAEWRERTSDIEASFPKKLPPDPIVFFAQSRGPFFADELDAMWASINHGVDTLNGYSGLSPKGFSIEYGSDCNELPRRVLAYLKFVGRQADDDAFRNLMRRIVPVGFVDCDPAWLQTPPSITTSEREYTVEEIRKITIHYLGRSKQDGQWVIDLRVVNNGDKNISALSGIGKPIRLSWRFVDCSGRAMTGWDKRMNLPFDINQESSLDIKLPVDPEMVVTDGSLQISIVQEAVFWAHDIGVAPLTIPWE